MRASNPGGRRGRSFPRPAQLALLAPLAVLCLAGCGGSAARGLETGLVPFTPEERALRDEAASARYRLRVGDTFAVDFKYEDQLDQKAVTVLPDGRISMPGMDGVRAAGLSVEQLDSVLTAHYAQDYLSPDLSVMVVDLGKSQIYVLGEVGRPGLYDIPMMGEGVLQAIAIAGGFTPDAKASETVVIRVAEEGFRYIRYNLTHLEKKADWTLAYAQIQPYDVIYVPRSAIGDLTYFTGNVLRTALDFSQLFWDVYALTHIEKVDRIVR